MKSSAGTYCSWQPFPPEPVYLWPDVISDLTVFVSLLTYIVVLVLLRNWIHIDVLTVYVGLHGCG